MIIYTFVSDRRKAIGAKAEDTRARNRPRTKGHGLTLLPRPGKLTRTGYGCSLKANRGITAATIIHPGSAAKTCVVQFDDGETATVEKESLYDCTLQIDDEVGHIRELNRKDRW